MRMRDLLIERLTCIRAALPSNVPLDEWIEDGGADLWYGADDAHVICGGKTTTLTHTAAIELAGSWNYLRGAAEMANATLLEMLAAYGITLHSFDTTSQDAPLGATVASRDFPEPSVTVPGETQIVWGAPRPATPKARRSRRSGNRARR